MTIGADYHIFPYFTTPAAWTLTVECVGDQISLLLQQVNSCHTLLIIITNLTKRATCVNSIPSLLGKKILQANMIVIQDIFSLLCGIIVPLMIIYFLMSRTAMQREPVENDERAVLANRTITNGQRRWASENISHSIQPSRNFPTEHDERYD